MIAGKRKTIGVFMCKAYSLFDNAVYLALEKEAKKFDLDVIVFTTVGYFASQNDYDSQERGMFDFAPIEKLDGIIIAPDTYEMDGFREELNRTIQERAKCPVVAIRHYSDLYDCIYTDENLALRPLMRHLLEEHQPQRVCFLAGYKGHPDSEHRLQVFREEMEEHELTFDEEKDIAYGNMWLNSGTVAYEAFFQDPRNMPDAVVCANDYMAAGLMNILIEKGIRIPEDVIVTGFDNVPNLTLDAPKLTTVEQDFTRMTEMAMEELSRQIFGKCGKDRKEGHSKAPIGGKFILGESCGCGYRGDDFYLQLCKERKGEIDQMNTREVSMTYLTIELSACDDLKDLHRVLVDKMGDTPMVRDYYLCLFEKGRNDEGEPVFAEEMMDTVCLVHAMRDRQDHGMPMISFDRHQLLPEMAERPKEPQVFYLMLLHQRENAYGYGMFHFQPGSYPSTFFQHWNVTLSGALSNMHKRDELMMLYEERRLSSITDVMTRLLNRRGLEEQLTPVWQRMCARQEHVAFVSFDMDRLKRINDSFGHQAGDYAIRLTANAIRRAAPKDAILARMGGDEFLAVLPRSNKQGAEAYMEAFRRELDQLNKTEDRAFNVEASCGAKVFKLNSLSSIEECIQQSDEMMYEQKELHHAHRTE